MSIPIVVIIIVVLIAIIIFISNSQNNPLNTAYSIPAPSAPPEDFFATHKKDEQLVKTFNKHYNDFRTIYGSDKKEHVSVYGALPSELSRYGAKVILSFESSHTTYKEHVDVGGECVIITENMVYVFNKIRDKELYYKKGKMATFVQYLKSQPIRNTYTTTKQASVVGQAVVGGAIAGGAGAVVGALNAASANANGGKTVTRTANGGYGVICEDISLDNEYLLSQVWIHPDIKKKYKAFNASDILCPDFIQNLQKVDFSGNYWTCQAPSKTTKNWYYAGNQAGWSSVESSVFIKFIRTLCTDFDNQITSETDDEKNREDVIDCSN